MTEAMITEALDRLRRRFGARFIETAAIREQHGKGESYHRGVDPLGVVMAGARDDVVDAVKICHEFSLPVIPFGKGTSLEGHVVPRGPAITIDLGEMNAVKRYSAEDLDATIEPGVTREDLNQAIRHDGLFFSVDPGANASIGGMASTRASGTNAVRYGTIRDNILALEVVLADGRVIRTGTRARKSAAGYDLTRMFIGAEGTLGIITELTVRVYPLPEQVAAATCNFPSIREAIATVTMIMQAGIPVARIEFLDDVQVDAVNRYSNLDLPVRFTLFFEFHGSPAAVADYIETVSAFVAENSGADFTFATTTEDRSRLWHARHKAYYACLALRPGSVGLATDVCVPFSTLADCIEATKADLTEHGLLGPIVGHVGDGNFHVCHVMTPGDQDNIKAVYAFNERLARRALEFGGTCTGEHGIGVGKIDLLKAEVGPAFEVMADLKRFFDPKGILNPGKVVGDLS